MRAQAEKEEAETESRQLRTKFDTLEKNYASLKATRRKRAKKQAEAIITAGEAQVSDLEQSLKETKEELATSRKALAQSNADKAKTETELMVANTELEEKLDTLRVRACTSCGTTVSVPRFAIRPAGNFGRRNLGGCAFGCAARCRRGLSRLQKVTQEKQTQMRAELERVTGELGKLKESDLESAVKDAQEEARSSCWSSLAGPATPPSSALSRALGTGGREREGVQSVVKASVCGMQAAQAKAELADRNERIAKREAEMARVQRELKERSEALTEARASLAELKGQVQSQLKELQETSAPHLQPDHQHALCTDTCTSGAVLSVLESARNLRRASQC